MKLKLLAAASLAIVMTAPALAGPPIGCHAIDIAKAKSIPMGSGAQECASGESVSEAVEDAVAILKGDSSPLVRMETLRRATVYVRKDQAQAKLLMSRVMALALDGAAKTDTDAAAGLFNAGFLAACYGEMGIDVGWKPGIGEGVEGYAWIKAAIAKLPTNAPERAEMEYGAALATHPLQHTQPAVRPLYNEHFAKAESGAKAGSLLSDNLKAYHALWDTYIEKNDSKKEQKEAAKPEQKK